jgi:hypothetical protein
MKDIGAIGGIDAHGRRFLDWAPSGSLSRKRADAASGRLKRGFNTTRHAIGRNG